MQTRCCRRTIRCLLYWRRGHLLTPHANPLDWRGCPLFSPPRPLPEMPPVVELTDLEPNKLGPLNLYMAQQLNVAGLRFYRFGVDGGGRCLVAAFYTALGKGHNDHPVTVRRAEWDSLRLKLREKWEWYNHSGQSRQRTRMREMVFATGNSGLDTGRRSDITIQDRTSQEFREAAREEAWTELGNNFDSPARSLGWDALAWMGTEHEVNVILFSDVIIYRDAAAGTKYATSQWKERGSSERIAATKQWRSSDRGTEAYVIPGNRVIDNWPFVVLYWRSETFYKWKKGRGVDDQFTSDGSGGHYEPVVTGVDTADSYVDINGCYSASKHPAVHAHLLALGKRLNAGNNNKESTERMAQDYNASAKVHEFDLLDAVAVRVPGKKPRSGDTTNSLPGLVIGIHRHDKGDRPQKVVHQTYTVWCVYGVLSEKLSVDMLNKLSMNSFPS